MAETRQRCRRSSERILDGLVADDLALDLALLARIRCRGLHDTVDEEAKPTFGRNTPGGGVRMGEKPSLLELRITSNRCRREADGTREHLRAYGQGRGRDRISTTRPKISRRRSVSSPIGWVMPTHS